MRKKFRNLPVYNSVVGAIPVSSVSALLSAIFSDAKLQRATDRQVSLR